MPHIASDGGGGTFAHETGASSELIKALGDWRSNAYLRYIEVSPAMRQQAASKMAQAAHSATGTLREDSKAFKQEASGQESKVAL